MEPNGMKEEALSRDETASEQDQEIIQETALTPMSPEETAEIEVEQSENYKVLSKEELVNIMESFLTEPDYAVIKSKINPLKDAFHDLTNHEKQQQLEKFIEGGGEKDDFKYQPDQTEIKFNSALRKINKRRIEFHENQEKLREENLAAKQEILQQLKDIIQNEENMSRAFNTFHDLQSKWRAIGPVPSQSMNDLWMTYKLYIEKFYDLIKINRELQDLDQKKNLEMKIHFCEKLEELILEPSLNKAFSKLQSLQNNWRVIGPIPRDKRTEIGERFKAAHDKIIERKKEYLEKLKEKQEENLKIKTSLCEKAEEIVVDENIKHHELQEKFRQIQELQLQWRQTGPAEKNADEQIWSRFKNTCDNFYKVKTEFYNRRKKESQANLQAKTELCIQAEALMNSTEWKKTADELKRLNEAWKKTGYVNSKVADKIWNRFRTACDAFFNNRKSHFSEIDKEHEENYTKKLELLERIEQFQSGENKQENLNQIKNFQREWTEIGLVPIGKKDEIFFRYKKLIDDLFTRLKLSERETREIRYKEKVDNFKQAPHSQDKITDEKRNLMHKISQLKNDVIVWENNLGFFAKSKNADQIKKEFEEKITKAKDEISKLKEQLQLVKTF
ncbi:MAG TPA: DUF349 domain-containing protein [Bacteroidia bacterium]|nr:DUF349 domain-containing protein [Bacteroidia bacterium]